MEKFARGISTKLCSAAEEGDLSEVKKCLSKGANVLARNTHHTILHSAVRSDNEEVVKLILDTIEEMQGTVRPYIDDKDTEGETPLMWTAKCKLVNSARILLEYGANIEAKNRTDMTALHWAAKSNHIEIIKLLISKGATINVKDINGLTPLDFVREETRGEIDGYLAFNVSEMLRKEGKYNDAWQAYQETLDKQEVSLGSNHPDVLITRHNMAVVLANQGKHSEALEIYQKVFDTQKRRDVLGPDHPDTLMTLYNMAVSFSALGDSNKVLSIFREFLNVNGVQLNSDHTIPLTNSEIKIKQKDSFGMKSNLSNEENNKHESYLHTAREVKHLECVDVLDEVTKGFAETNVRSNTEVNQVDQESDEEIFEPILDKLEALELSTKLHLTKRTLDAFIVRGKDGGRPAWHYVLVDQCKKEKFLEQYKKGSIDVGDYGKSLFSGFGENPPQNVIDNINEFFNEKIHNNFFIIKEVRENMSVYHYVLIDPDKKKLFLEQTNTGVSLLRKVENCGRILYSGLGTDPPEIISDKIIETYFCTNNGIVKDIFAALGFSSVGNSDWTTLHDAAYIGNLQLVKNLIVDGADLLVKDRAFGRMPVHIAAREGHTNVIELILGEGMNVNGADAKKWTSMHYAAWGGHLRTVKLLIDSGVDIHAKEGTHGKKAIHVAAERGYMNIVNLLLGCGMSMDDTDKEGRTSLYYAALRGHLEVVKKLADRGANIHAESIYGTKPIHAAALSGSINVIQFLLHRGVNVNNYTKDNLTPLHYAVENGLLGAVKFLINKGANIDVRDNEGKTPSDLARKQGHKEVVNLLDSLK